MNNVQDTSSRPAEAPDYPRMTARRVWPFTVIAIALMHFAFWRPGQQVGSYGTPPNLPLTIILIGIAGYGLAAIFALVRANAHRIGTVLWPSWGKAFGAFALMFVTPVAVLSFLPWIVGGLFLSFAFSDMGLFLFGLAAMAVLIPFWYPVSALIISGTRSKWLRFGIFCLIFWTAYAAHILYSGVQVFRL